MNGEHYAVPGDCSSFYVCDSARLNKRRCPTALLWNRQKKLCDWTYNVKCVGYDDSSDDTLLHFQMDAFRTSTWSTYSLLALPPITYRLRLVLAVVGIGIGQDYLR